MKRGLLLLVFLLAPFALADSMIHVSPVDNEISFGEEATFNLRVLNNAPERQRYSIYSLQSGQGWTVDPRPLKDRILELGTRQEHTTLIVARPLEEFPAGIYTIPLTVETDLGEKYDFTLKTYLSPEKPKSYLPTLKVDVDMDDRIDPKQPLSVKLFIENRNPLDMEGLLIRMQSEMREFNKEVAIDLPPLETKTVEFAVTPNPFQQPKEYTLLFVFEYEDQTVKGINQDIEIVPLVDSFTTDITMETVFLKQFGQVSITNPGNVLNTQEARIPLSVIDALLTSSKDGSVKSYDGQRYLTWQLELAPGAMVVKNYVTNRRVLLYLLIAIVLFLVFYWSVRSPIKITKKATVTKGEEGMVSQVKITLEVQNLSSKPIRSVEISDLVPAIANVQRSLELGTLKPHHIKHLHKGSKLIWKVAELDAREHRLITYKVKAKLNILGTFSLPRAIVAFPQNRGKLRKAYSNQTRLRN